MLQDLLIEQTKSRPRHTNDNPQVEGKNNFVIRKHFGYTHIPKKYASLINVFNETYFNPYLFFHRQCAYASEVVDAKGKIRKVYKDYRTPCEKLLSLENLEQYLKPGVTRESLTEGMMQKTHLKAAHDMQTAKAQLFETIRQKC